MKIDFDGYALGGLAVGESQNEMFQVLDDIKSDLPYEKPHYLMGVGTPTDILEQKRGIDMPIMSFNKIWKNWFSFYLGGQI